MQCNSQLIFASYLFVFLEFVGFLSEECTKLFRVIELCLLLYCDRFAYRDVQSFTAFSENFGRES